MDVGLNIAASAMAAEQVREDQLSNDLANASTPGYKPDDAEQSAFGTMLLTSQSGQSLGTIDTGVEISKEVANLTQGTLQSTGEPLDFAISGSGFFAVRTPSGVGYTRDGQFTASANGTLTDASGDPVLDQSGATIKVSSDGTVDASALGVFNLANPTKQGNNLFAGAASGRGSGTVLSGELESSAVDSAQTIVQMMTALNDYQSDENAVQTINQVEQRSSTSVGDLSGS